jgi:hypothetical protein
MELHERLDTIKSKTDLIEFIEALAQDLRDNTAKWENPTLESYLAALASWLEASDHAYANQGRPIPVTPSWQSVAEMLIAAKVYE